MLPAPIEAVVAPPIVLLTTDKPPATEGAPSVAPSAPAETVMRSVLLAKRPELLPAMMSAPATVAATSVAMLYVGDGAASPTLRDMAMPMASVSMVAVEPARRTTSPEVRIVASATVASASLAMSLSTTERPTAAVPMPRPSEPRWHGSSR